MKKLVLITLLMLLFFNQIGFQLIYWVEQIVIKKEQKELMLSLLPDYNFEKIEDNDKIQWEEEGKEFRYNNQMYDVARTKWINGKKVFFAIKDSKENELIQKLQYAILKTKEHNSTKGGHTSVIKFTQTVFIFQNIFDFTVHKSEKNQFLILNESISSDFLKNILIPPPQDC